MAKLEQKIRFKNQPELAINPSELLELYFHGIPICTKEGEELTYETLRQKILVAQRSVEEFLKIKLFKQVVSERTSFDIEEFRNWGFVSTTWPVKRAFSLDGIYNDTPVVEYVQDWLSTRSETNSSDVDRQVYFRSFHVVPGGTKKTGQRFSGINFLGASPMLLVTKGMYIPNYWESTYVTGFDKIPPEIIDVIGKLAAVQLFAILGDIFFGVGLNSFSISLDGLSQSTSLLKSAESGIYGARIKQYMSDLYGDQKYKHSGQLYLLKSKYRELSFNTA
jgi:hypothetical protein